MGLCGREESKVGSRVESRSEDGGLYDSCEVANETLKSRVLRLAVGNGRQWKRWVSVAASEGQGKGIFQKSGIPSCQLAPSLVRLAWRSNFRMPRARQTPGGELGIHRLRGCVELLKNSWAILFFLCFLSLSLHFPLCS